MDHCDEFYRRLGVTLKRGDVRGESAYNDDLPEVVSELKGKNNLATESDGAICVFPEGFKNKEGEPLPFIIQKSDGAYLYATTDLAAIRYRINELKADKIVYVTDSRQKLHFEMLFAVAKMAGWVSDDIGLSHVMFGSVLGEDGKPL
ncbi:MAG: arginine--tRNA ligase domain-containing protein, partial [Planctomycetota bacterium]